MATKDEGKGTGTRRRRPAAPQASADTAVREPSRRRTRRPTPAQNTPEMPVGPPEQIEHEHIEVADTRAGPERASIEEPALAQVEGAREAPSAVASASPEAGAGAAPNEPAAGDARPHRDRARAGHANALGMLIEAHFGDAASPCRSYSDLERHSGISREAVSRYVTARTDRRRSPTIDTLVAIADAMHLSLESIARAAAASVKGLLLPPEAERQAREEVLGTLVAALTDEQFSAVVELLRQLRPIQPRG